MILILCLGTASLMLIGAFIIFRNFVRRDYLKRSRLTPFSSFLELLIFFIHGSSSYIYLDSNPEHIRRDSPLFAMAALFMITGGVLVLLAMSRLGIGISFGKKAPDLKQSGFYRYTRNPQIVSYWLLCLGYAMLWPSWTGLLWLGILWAICHMMVLTEEEHLSRVFENEYETYCAQTPRYVGYRKN